MHVKPNTWRDLLDTLKTMESNNDHRLDDTVTVHVPECDEYYRGLLLEYEGDDILDNGHLFITTVNWNGEI